MSRLDREEHAISEDVWNHRQYVGWEPHDLAPLEVAYKGLSTGRKLIRKLQKTGGVVIPRYAPPGLGLDPIWPEVRPDTPVRSGRVVKHYHGDEPLTKVPSGIRILRPGRTRDQHINAKNPKYSNPHHGQNTNQIHKHAPSAKYVFPETPLVEEEYRHDHDAQYRKPSKLKGRALEKYREKKAKQLAGHLARQHTADGDIAGLHRHTWWVPNREVSLARRLDVHPDAVPLFVDAETVFFVIEGCIKADAVLSAGAAVFSVPSVSLWNCGDELDAFADRYLRGKRVIVVPDSDWHENWMVITQARLCQAYLRRRIGIEAYVAAPPADAKGKKQGVDDFLRHDSADAPNGKLDDLLVIETHLSGFVTYREYHKQRNRTFNRNQEVFKALSEWAGAEGWLYLSLSAIGKVLGMSKDQVGDALRDLIDGQLISKELPDDADADLEVAVRGWVGNDYYNHELDWVRRPAIIITEESRSTDLPPVKLGDFLTNLNNTTNGEKEVLAC